MSALMCGRVGCHTNAMPKQVNGVWTDPPGWTHVTVTGHPIVNVLLCPACATAVRTLLATGPADIERQHEADEAAAFARGYDAGLSEPREVEVTG